MTEKAPVNRKDKPEGNSCFPITEGVLTGISAEIRKDEQHFMFSTLDTIHENSPAVEGFLAKYAGNLGHARSAPYTSFLRGIFFTYAVLDKQAKQEGSVLKLTKCDVDGYAKDFTDYARSSPTRGRDWVDKGVKDINREEPALLGFINSEREKIGGVDIIALWEGMVHMYKIVKRQDEVKRMEEEFLI
jgi:hypothetical protein